MLNVPEAIMPKPRPTLLGPLLFGGNRATDISTLPCVRNTRDVWGLA
jgi:hypothetical protein